MASFCRENVERDEEGEEERDDERKGVENDEQDEGKVDTLLKR